MITIRKATPCNDFSCYKTTAKYLRHTTGNDAVHVDMQHVMKPKINGMDNTNPVLQQIRAFTEALRKDGIIDKRNVYIIEWKKEGHLYINHHRQTREVSDRYSMYYDKDGYIIKLNGENNIEVHL